MEFCRPTSMLTIAVKAVPGQLQGTLIRQERPWGNWSRKLELLTQVDSANIAAHVENGVLTVRVPKAAKAIPVRIPIGIADKVIEGRATSRGLAIGQVSADIWGGSREPRRTMSMSAQRDCRRTFAGRQDW